jgi:hypothetical protein
MADSHNSCAAWHRARDFMAPSRRAGIRSKFEASSRFLKKAAQKLLFVWARGSETGAA